MLVRTWGWLSPGGLHGLQNRPKGAAEAALVGSTPIHSRLFVSQECCVASDGCLEAVNCIQWRGALRRESFCLELAADLC